MNLVRWNPRSFALPTLSNVGDFDREFDTMVNRIFGESQESSGHTRMAPAMDWIAKDDHFLVRMDLPGLSKDNVEVTLKDGVLTVAGEKKISQEDEEARYLRRERYVGQFSRTLRLPEKVDAEKLTATFRDGVLELTLPLIPDSQPRRVQIEG